MDKIKFYLDMVAPILLLVAVGATALSIILAKIGKGKAADEAAKIASGIMQFRGMFKDLVTYTGAGGAHNEILDKIGTEVSNVSPATKAVVIAKANEMLDKGGTNLSGIDIQLDKQGNVMVSTEAASKSIQRKFRKERDKILAKILK